MNQLILWNLEEEAGRELEVRAVLPGRSAEAEHRKILREMLRVQGKRQAVPVAPLDIFETGGQT